MIFRLHYKKYESKLSHARPTVEGESSRLRDYVRNCTAVTCGTISASRRRFIMATVASDSDSSIQIDCLFDNAKKPYNDMYGPNDDNDNNLLYI